MASLIPMRPKSGTFNLLPEEMDGLTYYVLSGCSKKNAFITFCRPDMLASKAKAAIDEYIKQFFSRKDCIDYIESYKKTIADFLNPKKETKATPGSLEERKAKAKTKLIEFAMSLADDIQNASDPEFVLKMADKAGLLDSDENVEELPRRYLPVTCSSCEYRKFVEENCERVDDGTEFESDQQ